MMLTTRPRPIMPSVERADDRFIISGAADESGGVWRCRFESLGRDKRWVCWNL